MPELLVATRDFAAFFDAATPAVLVAPDLFPALRAWESGWRAFAARLDHAGDLRIARDVEATRDAASDMVADFWTPAPSFPAHVLALLGGAPPALDAFAPALPPPVIAVETAEAALARLADLL
ncbi:hypothetical protein, partial [Rhodoblastus acidophilus]